MKLFGHKIGFAGDESDPNYQTYDYVIDWADAAEIDELEAHQRGEAHNAIQELHGVADYMSDRPDTAGTCKEAIEVIKTRHHNRN